ncbi:hypothetical protein ACWDA7_38775 [Streptomyces sp. NPDC001156]
MLTLHAGLTPPAAVFLAVSLYAASLVPFFLLIEAEHLAPRPVRELPATARAVTRDAALSAAVLLMLLTPAAPEASR